MSNTNNTKQAAWVAIGSLFSFGFGIISSMILSRYFDKADYGTYKQVIYVYNTLLAVFTLGLPKAFSYFLPRVDVNQAKNLIMKITNIFFILGGLFSCLLFVFSKQIAILLNNPDLNIALRLFSIVPLLMLPTMGLEGILSTYKQNKFMAVYTVCTRIVMLCCIAIPVMIWDLGYKEAIIGFVIGSFISFILALYLKYYPVRQYRKYKCNVSYKEIFKFSLPLLYASLWGMIIASADQFFISRYFGNVEFAEFSNGSMELPFVGMIVGACATVLSPIFSKLSYENIDPKKEIYPLWMSVFEKTAKLIYPLLIYCWFFADIIMVILYGGQYVNSSIYFRIKLITNFFTLIVYGPLLINIGKVKYYSNVHMWIAIEVVLLEFLSVKIIHSPYAIAIISLLCQLGKIWLLLLAVAKYFGMKTYQLFPIKLIVKIVVPSIVILGLERYLLIDVLQLHVFWVFVISFVLYIIVFYIYSLIVKLDYMSIIKPLLKKEINN